MPIVVVVLMYALWSSVFSLGKLALQYSPPVFLTSIRMLLAGALLLSYLSFRRPACWRLTGRQYASLGLLALFSVYLTNVLEFWGLQYLSAAKTCFIYSLSPFFAALFSYLHFKEKINTKKTCGLILGFLGCLPVLVQKNASELNQDSLFSWPTLAVMGAALCSVYGWVLLRVILKSDNTVSPLMANGTSMLMGGLLAGAHALLLESPFTIPISPTNIAPLFGLTLLMTLLYNVICYNVYGMMLKRFTATFLSFMGLLSPFFASLSGWLFLGEPIQWSIFASTGTILIGLWIVYNSELKQGYIRPLA